MHSEKDSPISDAGADGLENSQEITLNWLLELDRDEPQEKLFVVDCKQPVDTKLSAFEAEVAARPMMRGRAGADEFDSYVGEEIVISSEGASSDIYSSTESQDALEDSSIEEAMALDFSRSDGDDELDELAHLEISDGDDILCLEDNDDIGETYFIAKRVKRDGAVVAASEHAQSVSTSPDPAPVAQASEPEPALEDSLELTLDLTPEIEVQESLVSAPNQDLDEPRIMGELNLNQVDVEELHLELELNDEPDEVLELELPNDLDGYITNVTAPADDQAFDDYLVAGSHLLGGSDDIPDLPVSNEQGVVFADLGAGPQSDDYADYHEDFQAVVGFDDDTTAAITPLIASLMGDVEAQIQQRLDDSGQASDSVEAQIIIAVDESSRGEAQSQGFAPVAELVDTLPDEVAALQPDHLGAIYLLLLNTDSGETCNNLLQESPVVQDGPESPAKPVSSAPRLEIVESIVFKDDIFDTDVSDAALAMQSIELPDDIDAVFDDFSAPSESTDDIFGLEIEELSSTPDGDELNEFVALQVADDAEPTGSQTIAAVKATQLLDLANQLQQLESVAAQATAQIHEQLLSVRQQLVSSDESCEQILDTKLREGITGVAGLVDASKLVHSQASALLNEQAAAIGAIERAVVEAEQEPSQSAADEAVIEEATIAPYDDSFLALVVDDSRTQRMVATSQLETVGIQTATAENGAVAIDWLSSSARLPDVILLDVEMPVKDGIQTLREIRKSSRYDQTPVIMITSRTGIKHRSLAEQAGCNGYMGKPFNFRNLIGQINELTGDQIELS